MWLIPVFAIAVAAGIGLARPQWIYRDHMVIEFDGHRQTDQKWFGGIPYSKVESIPDLKVSPLLAANLARLLHHPKGVDSKPIDATRYLSPTKRYYVRLHANGDLKKITKEYAAQLTKPLIRWPCKGVPGELFGFLKDGRKMQASLWDAGCLGGSLKPTDCEFAFQWAD